MDIRTRTALLLPAAALAAALAACSSAPAASAGKSPPAKDTAAACAAVVDLESVIPPGADPDAPAPAPAEMQAWAAQVSPYFATASANLPDALHGGVVALGGVIDRARQGGRVDITDPAVNAATGGIDAWMHDNCGYQTLDVVSTGRALDQVPGTLKAGPTVVRFTNTGTPPGFVLLLARLKDGQDVTAADLDSGRADITQVADVVAGAQPTGPGPAYSTARLTPGRYVVSALLGSSPQTITGSASAAFTVS